MMILLIVVLAFVASYQAATAIGPGPSADSGDVATSVTSGGGELPCACCSNGGTGETIEGTASTEGGVQRISIDASNGYNPNVIRLAAGIPAEITFGQGSGCMGQVMSEDFGFYEDLTTGPKTVRIEAEQLQPGEYGFSCGMQMVFGTIIVE